MAEALYAAERHVKLINPLSARRFAQLRLRRTKSDPLDARLLSDYGAIATEPSFVPLSEGTNSARQH
jgi:transposase